MTTPTWEGGCLCGEVRYRISGTPRALSLCHCRTCRRAAGAPSVAWVVLNATDLVILQGMPSVFRSSPDVLRTFCGRCGTSLTYQRESQLASIDITTASLDEPDTFPPEREIWLSHKIDWERDNDSLRQYDESSKGSASS